MSRLRTNLTTLGAIAILMIAWSPPAWTDGTCAADFQSLYGSGADTTYGSAGCQTCHSGNIPLLNGYGIDVASCTMAAIQAAEDEDSDTSGGFPSVGGDNLTEILAGAQPGWCEPAVPGCDNVETPPANITGPLDPAPPEPPPANEAPVAVAGGPYDGEAGTPVQFDGTASFDPDGDPLQYDWSFGDGNSGTGPTPLHTYAGAGSYSVTLVVDDGVALSPPDTTTATVAEPVVNVPPVADAGGPYGGDVGEMIQLDGSGSADPNGDPLTYTWNFGDGSSGNGVSPSHSYSSAGLYTITLFVNDGQSDSTPDSTTVDIIDPAPGGDGEALYDAFCLGCHGDPWAEPTYDDGLPGLRRVAGARACTIYGSVFGTSVYPGGVPDMQFLQDVLSEADYDALAGYLNSMQASGGQRYVTACAGCHGIDGSGGPVDEDVHGDEADETEEAIEEDSEMQFLACLPDSDIVAISDYLMGFDDDNDDDGIDDDEDADDDNDGIDDDEDTDDDNDGIDDDAEHGYGTDPRNNDSDDDGLHDGDEVNEHGTDPTDHDSDDDEVEDGREIENGTDPRDADSDDDDLTDGEEIDAGTDPLDDDTDDDGFSDGREVKLMGTDPLVANATSDSSSGGGGGGAAGLWLLLYLLASYIRAATRLTRR